jgi:hypothetical protein
MNENRGTKLVARAEEILVAQGITAGEWTYKQYGDALSEADEELPAESERVDPREDTQVILTWVAQRQIEAEGRGDDQDAFVEVFTALAGDRKWASPQPEGTPTPLGPKLPNPDLGIHRRAMEILQEKGILEPTYEEYGAAAEAASAELGKPGD